MRQLALIAFAASVISGMVSVLLAVYYQHRSAQFRKPGVSRWTATWFPSVFVGDPLYTEQAWPYRKRCMLGPLGFFVFNILAMVIGWSTGVAQWSG